MRQMNGTRDGTCSFKLAFYVFKNTSITYVYRSNINS